MHQQPYSSSIPIALHQLHNSMDQEEASFADLLARSTAPAPLASSIFGAQNEQEQDPWANPFAASSGASASAGAVPEVSPYVTQLEDEGVIPQDTYVEYTAPERVQEVVVQAHEYRIDPPSVIVQLEQEDDEEQAMLAALQKPSAPSSFAPSFSSPSFAAPEASASPMQSPYTAYTTEDPFSTPTPAPVPTKAQPTDDLLGLDQYVDPSEALKKAFVKSSTPKVPSTSPAMSPQKKVVNRGKRGIVAGVPSKPAPKSEGKTEVKSEVAEKTQPATAPVPNVEGVDKAAADESNAAAAAARTDANSKDNAEAKVIATEDKVVVQATSDAIQAEDKAAGESTNSRDVVDAGSSFSQSDVEANPPPDSLKVKTNPTDYSLPTSNQSTPTASHVPLPESRTETPSISRSETPTRPDRVITSPLETPSGSQTSFAALSIGASSSGKGWAAVDGDDGEEEGLFGKGFAPPTASSSTASPSPWGAVAQSQSQTGWGDEEVFTAVVPPRPVTPPTPAQSEPTSPDRRTSSVLASASAPPPAAQSPRQKPLFSISVDDPTKVGDPIRGHIVYTVRTRTTSPHFHKGDFSSLRRFSDFLWLFEALTLNNPGVIVPPVPDKHPFGRFQDQFVETRRLALERCLRKMAAHPVLQLDPDLKLFLESDSFAIDIKQRKLETPQEKQGYLASWTGPKYFEQDEWFDSRKIFLESLETQLKGLVKSIDTTSKQRLELALNVADFADGTALLADSDLGSALSSALARLADLARQEKEAHEEQAKADVVHIMSSADEYLRLIASVRLAFASRIKAWVNWQNAEKDVVRIRAARDKARQQGRSVAEGEGERRAREAAAEFEQVSRLVKSEFARFEKERVEEFKRMLERYLDGMISRQKELMKAWEEYHGVILKMVQSGQAQRQAVAAQ